MRHRTPNRPQTTDNATNARTGIPDLTVSPVIADDPMRYRTSYRPQ